MTRNGLSQWSVVVALIVAAGCGSRAEAPDGDLSKTAAKPTTLGASGPESVAPPVSVDVDREVQALSKLANLTELQARKAKKVLDVVAQMRGMVNRYPEASTRARRLGELKLQTVRGLSAVVTQAQQGSLERYVSESSLFQTL
jgi:hypothetical protein